MSCHASAKGLLRAVGGLVAATLSARGGMKQTLGRFSMVASLDNLEQRKLSNGRKRILSADTRTDLSAIQFRKWVKHVTRETDVQDSVCY